MHCETLRVRIAVALWLCLSVVPSSRSQSSATTTDKSPTPGAAQSKRSESGRKQGVKPKRNKGQKAGERSRSNENRSRQQDRSPAERPSLDPAKDLELPPRANEPAKAGRAGHAARPHQSDGNRANPITFISRRKEGCGTWSKIPSAVRTSIEKRL